LWCWVSKKWDFLRIATFYGPVWVVIAITFTIYIWAGKEMFARRRQLRNFSSAASDAAFPVIQNPFLSPFVSVKTTDVTISTNLAEFPTNNMSTNSFVLNENGRIVGGQGFDPYSVSIGAGRPADVKSIQSSVPPRLSTPMMGGVDLEARQRRAAMEANKAAFSYCKCALLFFASLLITWVPSSMNRFYSLVHPDRVSFPLLYISALVLPLQGFWNAVIYIATSLPACKALYNRILDSLLPNRHMAKSSPYPRPTSRKGSMVSSEGSMTTFSHSHSQNSPSR
jgi:hypothetical protein